MMTEITERRRRQTLRTIITEIFMLIIIIILVVVLALVAMGYRINFEKGFEHSGLVQINSIPTGAAITVDGEGVFLPTNQSRTMVSGPHEITLTKDGFTSWSKTINVTEGLMYRLSYPRLYKEDRESTPISLALENENENENENGDEHATTIPTPEHAFVSPDRKLLLLTFADSNTWRYLNLNDDTPRARSLSVEGIIATGSELEIIAWSDNNNRLLIKHHSAEQVEWLILNLNKPTESINLTKEFGLTFTDIRLESNDKLLALSAGQLREINLSSLEISKVLISDVESFSNLGFAIVYVGTISTDTSSTTNTQDTAAANSPARAIFTYTIGDDAPSFALPLADGATVHLTLSEYYGDSYLAYTSDQQFFVYYGNFPNNGDDFADRMELSASTALDFTPAQLSVRGDGELIIASHATDLSVFDAESYSITTFTTESTPTWLTGFDFYTIQDDWLTVHDFDGSNPHALASSVSATLPATISENNRYLYYFTTTATLQREPIR